MIHFKSLTGETSRRLFLTFFAISSLLPLLVLVFIVYQYLFPFIEDDKSGLLGNALTYGILIMLLFPLLSSLLMFRWIGSLEYLTNQIRDKSTEIKDGTKEFADQEITIADDIRPKEAGPVIQ
jgi:hypothetical protein